MTRIRVVVTAEDIAAGHPCSSSMCPLARAVQRAGFPNAAIGGLGVWYPDGVGSSHVRELPEDAARFVKTVDGRLPVAPTTFYLEGPDRL